MALSINTISKFVKVTKDDNKQTQKETIVYGKITSYDASSKTCFVRLDGSDIDLPVTRFTTTVNPDERVTVMIKNHTAVITGNLKSPAAGAGYVDTVVNTKFGEISIVNQEFIDSLWEGYTF